MIIACDTSSAVCSVAVSHKGKVIFSREAVGGQIHIEKLSPFLQEALAFCDKQEHAVEALAIAIGPGSFNGLRIGLATIKALSMVLKLPLIPIPTTDAMALGIQQGATGHNRAVIYSHRNFVHTADYDFDLKEQFSTPEHFYQTWDQLYNEKIDNYFGVADRGFAQWLDEPEGKSVADRFTSIKVDAAYVALLAETRLAQATTDLDNLEPFYNAKYEAKKWIPPSF